MTDITVCIPTIPPRHMMLLNAVSSVLRQDRPAEAISIAVDLEHMGAWHTRQRALDAAQTEWVAFLDDDDMFKPMHLAHLLDYAVMLEADYVFSYYDTAFTHDYLHTLGKPFDPEHPHHTTMTILVKTDLAKSVGFTPRAPEHEVGGEDWRFTIGCVEAGARIVHLPEMTWIWRHHYRDNNTVLANTSGREDRW